jgi:hypothetical protein
MSDHTFTKEEISRIIKKATQLEKHQLSKDDEERGLTLEELITAASDAGLDPENIRIVARELREGKVTEETSLDFNFKGQVFAERWIEGRLSDELADSVIADLRHRYDASEAEKSWFNEWRDEEWEKDFGKSTVQKTGRSVEWKHIDRSGSLETRVLLQPRGKQIRVRVSKRNLWDEKGAGPGGEVFEFIDAIPLVAGIALLFTLPFDFFINMVVGLLAYIGLKFIVLPLNRKLREKWGRKLFYRNRPRIEENRERYKMEVELLADDISGVLKTDLDDSMIDNTRKIELDHLENTLRDAEEDETRRKSGNKNRIR